MKFIEKVRSKEDSTQKFIFENNQKQVLEVAYIDNGTGKDIFCVPTQSACLMACKFCQTRDIIGKVSVNGFWAGEIVDAVKYAYTHLETQLPIRPMLVSFMGCGEPLKNDWEMLQAMRGIRSTFAGLQTRFAFATIMPKGSFPTFVKLAEEIKKDNLNVKAHLSLHFTEDVQRNAWMPNAEKILPSLNMLEWYGNYTGNKTEIHYTPIFRVNDREDDAWRLGHMLQWRRMPVKLLQFNSVGEQITIEKYQGSPEDTVKAFRDIVEELHVPTEFYTPPGRDIGASCGQLLVDYYIKPTKYEMAGA